jgi:hypothetical protein
MGDNQAQPEQFRVPQGVDKFSGDSAMSPDEFLAELDNWFHILSTPTTIRSRMTGLFLSGAAKEWYYNEFMNLTSSLQSYDDFKQKLRSRFARGDENVIARRLQQSFRITRSDPPNFITSVNDFNASFTRNQVKIKNQGEQDAMMAYRECIRNSIPLYEEVLQLQQSLDNTFTVLPSEQQTLSKAQEIVALRAPNVIDIPHPISHPHPHRLHAINYNNPPPQRTTGYKRPRTRDGRMSYLEARRLKICTYCRNQQADHKQVRAYNPRSGKYDGEIICNELKRDIASGQTREQRPGENMMTPPQHLNSYGSRTSVTTPAAN